MRVGIVTTWFERGAAYVSRQYMSALEAKGHEVYIYARGGEKLAKGDLNWDGPRVTWGKSSFVPGATTMDRKDFLRWISKNSIQIILFNEQHWMPPVLWAREAGVITIAYIDYYTEKTVPFFAVYDGLVCNTKRHYEVFAWHKQCVYVPWGTDTKLFSFSSRGVQANKDCIFFHSAGMSPYRKGTDLVLDAFSRMKRKSSLIIHSQVNLLNEFPRHSRLIADLIENERLRIIEGDVTAPGLYHLGDVYVYPSRLEGIGLTQVEALASGLPLITSDSPPMNEFINQETGVTVPVRKLWSRADGYYWPQCEIDVDSLATVMDMYALDTEIVDKKNRARGYAEKNLDWVFNSSAFIVWLENLKHLTISATMHDEIIDYYPRDTRWYMLRTKLKKWFGV